MTAVPTWIRPALWMLGGALIGSGLTLTLVDDDPVAPTPASAEVTTTTTTLAPTTTTNAVPVPVSLADRLAAVGPTLSARIGSASCLVVAVDDDAVVRAGTTAGLVPASLMKLPVGLTALDLLGPEATLDTEVRSVTHPDSDGNIAGHLWLVGGGDPLLGTADYFSVFTRQPQVFTDLERLADAVVAAGVRRVAGRVIGIEDRYDTVRFGPGWSPTTSRDHETGPMSALTVNDGFTSWVGGHKVPAADPAADAARQFHQLLSARGVQVDGGAGVPGPGGITLAAVPSLPLGDIVAEMLRESDNQTAELMVKELGAAVGGGGSTADGMAVVNQHLANLGVDLAGYVGRSGSGLGRDNKMGCATVVEVLAHDRSGVLTAGLAVAGRTGTLAGRMTDGAAAGVVRAKTGSLNGIASLAGVVDTPEGTVRFAVIATSVSSRAAGIALTDGIAERIAQTITEGAA